jgi:hypothetical protein
LCIGNSDYFFRLGNFHNSEPVSEQGMTEIGRSTLTATSQVPNTIMPGSSLKRFFKQISRSVAMEMLAFGEAYPTRLTDKATLEGLLHKLSPVTSGIQLIRLGPKGDGGYLVPDDLTEIAACFSPGVGNIFGFEKDCAARGMQIFLADGSVERPDELHDRFCFTKKYVGITTGDDFMTIDDWVASSPVKPQADLMLQIDIEGYEYETFLGISDALMRRLRIIVAEFHHLDQLWNGPFFQIASRVFEKILQTHACVHIHPNNRSRCLDRSGLSIPPLAEFTFLRKDRIRSSSRANVFPHPLDCDNSLDDPHFPLPKCWYNESHSRSVASK